MNSNPLSNHIAATYQAIRIGLAIITFLFPPWLVLGGKLFAHPPLHLQDSMSSYYHASDMSQQNDPDSSHGVLTHPGEGTMRNWFVGLLFAVGIILYLYKGFTWLENWALNIGGVLALGVALFPMAWGKEFPGLDIRFVKLHVSVHGACAVSLFLCLAYVCIFRASDTLPLVQEKARRDRYRKTYHALGVLMAIFPLIAWGLTATRRHYLVIFMEALGIWVFAAYWAVKSREIAETDADKKALRGQLKMTEPRASHFAKTIPITE